MNKNRIRWIYFVIMCLAALLIVSGESIARSRGEQLARRYAAARLAESPGSGQL